jgi:hypothetical protein
VNAPPYFFELDLQDAVDNLCSRATVNEGQVTLKLFKAHPGRWGRLIIDLPREARLVRREKSCAAAHNEVEAAMERRRHGTWEDSRFSLGKQMVKDRQGRARIEYLKGGEADAEVGAMRRWQNETRATEERLRRCHSSLSTTISAQQRGQHAGRATLEQVRSDAQVPAPPYEHPPYLPTRTIDAEHDEIEPELATGQRRGAKTMLPVRGKGNVKVAIAFTPQLLSGPARTRGGNADFDLPPVLLDAPDLRAVAQGGGDISQRDPAWLKDRGDRYFRLGDWGSAEEVAISSH